VPATEKLSSSAISASPKGVPKYKPRFPVDG